MGEQNKNGFTIVELLIVVVVIAILAAITIVAYNGIQQRSVASSLQSTVSQSSKKIELLKQSNTANTYPANQADAQLPESAGTTVNYFYNSGRDSYCIEATRSGQVFSSSSNDMSVKSGKCIENGLVGWWPLNGNANDQSGNGFNGTVSGASVTQGRNGQSGGAYLFDGVDDVLTFGNSPVLSPTSAGFTVSAWFRRDGVTTPEQGIVRKDNVFQLGNANASSTRNMLGTTGGTTGWTGANDFGYAYTTGTWYQASFAWDGKTLKSYVNGVQVRSVVVTGDPVTNSLAVTSSRVSAFFQGALDDVRIYSRALSTEEMAAIYSDDAK